MTALPQRFSFSRDVQRQPAVDIQGFTGETTAA